MQKLSSDGEPPIARDIVANQSLLVQNAALEPVQKALDENS